MKKTRFMARAASAAMALAAIFGSANSYAAKFANQFVEFELPPQWQCNLEGAEWVCQSLDEQKKRDAIIVLAAKLKGDQDSLSKIPRPITTSRALPSPRPRNTLRTSRSAITLGWIPSTWPLRSLISTLVI
jgi:hypothetical protein